MNLNKAPLIITASGAILLTLVQQFIRPQLVRAGFHSVILGSAPNLLVGLCFPFSILMRPTAFTRKTASRLFYLWCAGSLVVLIAFEFYLPFAGAQTFDPMDIAASVVGVAAAFIFHRCWLENRLHYGNE